MDTVRLHYSKKAEMGAGTLVIFIALLLVAAVAAGVVIQTASSLQQKALSTGSQATDQVATNAQILEISAEDGSNQNVEDLYVIGRLAPGSDPIKFNEVTVTVFLSDSSTTYTYGTTANTTAFTVEYLQTGVNNQTGVFIRGDVVKLNMTLARSVNESEFVRFNFIPKSGTASRIQFYTPDVMSTQQVFLYP